MRSALYYPHTEIRTEALWKSALLMWDEIHTIAPYEGFRPTYSNNRFAKAFELIGVLHRPSDEEKHCAHEVIKDFATRPLPQAFSYKLTEADVYEMYPDKFFPETWALLKEAGLSGAALANHDYPTANPTGLSLMSILADSCAGNALVRVTDRGEAYATLSGLFLEDPWYVDPNKSAPEQLVPIALQSVNLSDISLDRLIELRRNEAAQKSGTEIRRLRHRLIDHLEKQGSVLRSAKTKGDVEQFKKEFAEDLKSDFDDLREALKLRYVDALTTKEIITTIMATVTTAAALAHFSSGGLEQAAAAVGLGTLGGVIGTASKMFSSRKKIMLDHPTAYLYEIQSGIKL